MGKGIRIKYIFKLDAPKGYGATMTLESIWEKVENSEFVIMRYRETSGTSDGFEGDSMQNVIGDLTACSTGYMISWWFDNIGVPWFGLFVYFASEITLLATIRDSLLLTFMTLIKPNEMIAKWQEEGIEIDKRRRKNKIENKLSRPNYQYQYVPSVQKYKSVSRVKST
jgi:hypothetical protein